MQKESQVKQLIEENCKDLFPDQLVEPAITLSKYLIKLYFNENPRVRRRAETVAGGVLMSTGIILGDLPIKDPLRDVAIIDPEAKRIYNELRKAITRPEDYEKIRPRQKTIAEKLNASKEGIRKTRKEIYNNIYSGIVESDADRYKFFLRLFGTEK